MRSYVLRNRDQLYRLLRAISSTWRSQAEAGRPLEVVISELGGGGRRSEAQLRFYWGVVLAAIAEQAVVAGRRFAPEAWHEHYCRTFIGVRDTPDGPVGLSSSELSVEDFSAFISKVEADAAHQFEVRFEERV